MASQKSIFTRLRKDRRSQMFIATSLLIAFYILSITVILLEIRLATDAESDIRTVKDVYQSIQRESLKHTEALLNRWKNGLEPDASALETEFETYFIPLLVEYALSYDVQAVIIPDFTPGFTNPGDYRAQFTLNVSLYTDKTTITSEYEIFVIVV
ncbi:MAG: hypothetical protein ACFFBD_00030 [Candidatus Hodarchaeota archaeon]